MLVKRLNVCVYVCVHVCCVCGVCVCTFIIILIIIINRKLGRHNNNQEPRSISIIIYSRGLQCCRTWKHGCSVGYLEGGLTAEEACL